MAADDYIGMVRNGYEHDALVTRFCDRNFKEKSLNLKQKWRNIFRSS